MDGQLVIVFLGIILLTGFFIGHAVANKSNGQSGVLWGLGAVPDRLFVNKTLDKRIANKNHYHR